MNSNQSFFLKLLSAFILTTFCVNANALLSYKYNWTKIKSENFVIIVDKEYTEYGKIVATKAELAFQALQKFSKKHPRKTFIIVDHTKGFSNGSATYFPYPIIRLQPVTPHANASVGQYKDWLYELLVHEYTHILTFHNTRGIFTPLRFLLGSAISPGYFMPTWYQEGIAVFTETHLSNGGRLRSSAYNSYKEELQEPSISFANENASGKFPYGSAPYIYGAWLNENAFQDSGMKGASKVHKTFSGRLPYFINGGYKKKGNKSLYKSWSKLFGRKKIKEAKLIRKEGDDHSFLGRMPYWDSKTKTLYYIKLDPYLFDTFIARTENGKENVLFSSRNILSYKIVNNTVFYTKLSVKDRDKQLYTLFTFGLKNKKTKKYRSSFNVQSFDVNEENEIVFVDAKVNTHKVFKGNVDDIKNAKELYTSAPETRLSNVVFKNKTTALLSVKNPNEPESLSSINFETKELSPLKDFEHIISIQKELGQFYVLNELKGQKYLYNIAEDTSLQIKKSSQFITFKNQEELITANITSKDLAIFTENISNLKEETFAVAPIIKNEYLIEDNNLEKSDFKLKRYSSFSKLLPHYIVPNAEVSPYGFSGELLVGASIGSQDPLGLQSYSLTAQTDTITERLSGSFNYRSNHFRLPISLSTGILNSPLSTTIFKEDTFASVGTGYNFQSSFTNSLLLNVQALWSATRLGANAASERERLGAAASISLNNSELRLRELSPRKGYNLILGTKHYLPGDELIDYTQSFMGGRLFLKSPLAKTHRIILGFDGEVNSESLPVVLSSNSLNQPYRTTQRGSLALRGLPTGSLFATDSFAMAHLEYRFPIVNINWGPGLLPGFFNRITGAITADYGSIKGVDFINASVINHSTPLYSVGGELVFEGKLFYHLPASLQIGLYKFLNDEVYDDSAEIFVGFGITGLPY